MNSPLANESAVLFSRYSSKQDRQYLDNQSHKMLIQGELKG